MCEEFKYHNCFVPLPNIKSQEKQNEAALRSQSCAICFHTNLKTTDLMGGLLIDRASCT